MLAFFCSVLSITEETSLTGVLVSRGMIASMTKSDIGTVCFYLRGCSNVDGVAIILQGCFFSF